MFAHKGAVSQTQVGFSAALFQPVHQSHLGNLQTIVFDHVFTNTDNVYSTHTGVFRVPVSGTYVVSVYIIMGAVLDGDVYFEVVEDGNKLGDILINNIVSNSPDGRPTVTWENSAFKLWLFHLNKGSEVWVRVASYSVSPEIHGNGHSMFNAWLLFPDA